MKLPFAAPSDRCSAQKLAARLLRDLPDEISATIQIERGSCVKRDERGKFEYASPIPIPFSYGEYPKLRCADGGGLDVVFVGTSGSVGETKTLRPIGVAAFCDGHHWDPKLLARSVDDVRGLACHERWFLSVFFTGLVTVKNTWGFARGCPVSRFWGIVEQKIYTCSR